MAIESSSFFFHNKILCTYATDSNLHVEVKAGDTGTADMANVVPVFLINAGQIF